MCAAAEHMDPSKWGPAHRANLAQGVQVHTSTKPRRKEASRTTIIMAAQRHSMRRASAAAWALVALVAACAVGSAQAAPYKLWAGHSGKCVNVPGANRSNGVQLIQWNCNEVSALGSTSNDAFYFVPAGGGAYYIKDGIGRCMDVNKASMDDGAAVIMWPCHGRGNQLWRLTTNNQIVNLNSNKCLDVTGASTGNGASIIQWRCHGKVNQYFKLVSA